MKLLIEEKAKAYDEIIKKANKMHHENCEACQACIEELIPELAESKDERIIKAIKSAVLQLTDIYLQEKYGLKQSDCIAWLEKQGKNNMDISEATKQKLEDNLNKVLEKETSESLNEFLDEQKPADKVEPKFKVKYTGSEYNVLDVKDIAGVTFYGIEDEPNHIDYVQAENCERVGGYSIKENGSPYPTKPAKFSEHNSNCSEENEIRLKHILRLLDVKDDKKYLFMFGLNSLQDLEKDIAWLKSLKDKLQPQQKQEWSEEDVNFIEATIGLLNLVTPIDAASWGKSRLDCVDWLKSLKDKVGREVNCTTTKEWSEEDKNHVKSILSTIECCKAQFPNSQAVVEAYNADIEWLKSLKDRYTWKPRKKQKEELLWCVVHLGGADKQVLGELLEQLNKL